MQEHFLNGFILNNNYNQVLNSAKTQNKTEKKEEKLFNFDAEDKFTASFRKNKVESEYSLLNRYEKDSAKAKQLEKEIAQIKALEAKSRDYFSF